MSASAVLWGWLAASALDGGQAPEVAPAVAGLDGGTFEAPGGEVAGAPGPRDAAAGADLPPVGRAWGTVLAKGSRGAVVGARLVATLPSGATVSAEADDHGRFAMDVPCGRFDLAARAPGYEPVLLAGDACGEPARLVVRLPPRSNLPPYETVVVAPSGAPSVELRGPELTSTPGSLGDPFRAIESLPGVATVAWPAPIYAIRGSNPGNTGYFLDELQVPLLFHLLLGPAVIHPALFEGIDFYPGGYPARYGRFVAGIVAARTRAPPEERVRAVAEVRLYDAGALVSAPFPDDNGGVAVAFRYAYTGLLLSRFRDDLKLSYWDYQARAERRWRGWRLTLFVFGSSDDLRYHPSSFLGPGLGASDADLEDRYQNQQYLLRFHRASLRATRRLGGGQLSGHLAVGSDRSTAPLAQVFPVSLRSVSLLPRLAYQRPAAWGDWQTGLEAQLQWFRPWSTVEESGAWDLARRRAAALVAGYGAAAVRLGSRLTLTPGLRLDSYTISGTTKLDLGPRLAARLALDEQTWLAASGGRTSQAPSLTVQFPAAESFGLALLGLQTSWHGSLGLGTRRWVGFELEVTGFVQRYVLTDLRDPTLTEPDPLASDFLVRRDARAYGVEVMLRRPSSERLHGWLAYTWSKSERALGGGVIGPSDWDQRHILNLVAGYRLGRYSLGARLHAHSGQPKLVSGERAETFVRLPAYYQLDVRLERRFLFDTFSLDLYVEVVNTTMSRQVYGLKQDRQTGEIDEYSLRLILPSVGIRAEL